jgi:hypothetical protein
MRGVLFSRNNSWLLKLNFQNNVSLIKLRRPREIAERQKETSQHAKQDDPDFFKQRVPETPKIEPALGLGVIPYKMWRCCTGCIRRRRRSCSRGGWINHKGELNRPAFYTRRVFPQRVVGKKKCPDYRLVTALIADVLNCDRRAKKCFPRQ